MELQVILLYILQSILQSSLPVHRKSRAYHFYKALTKQHNTKIQIIKKDELSTLSKDENARKCKSSEIW